MLRNRTDGRFMLKERLSAVFALEEVRGRTQLFRIGYQNIS
ncbi:hypothetical protein BN2476_350056 [Paraburkholderia piptadeniae]|uniref:Uncharacterized protein n=1 Tax=Paraburkholderia piptadeniae TaxID=1701573 RepID=A0A1N7S7P3_9BURK|nr:hypothetical protein BN2476_350056 [Paraburkholderia piptadeniae]